ncbi:hypothetical protein [Lentzea flaviverrucosa]|uniref:Uncharacterized protein n=1 Tax=Lentzea flaviverrucosa TaxID=200379 RepID=A0A1H9XXC1_9PSEU|nr:hypothetical protein [Lentzea flaviverrucosa]RDI34422.1 hypothetical protein DFR72_101169 [Lentzea flaviverrucosa]SES50407.1 hypothetical protein SAMN05216195_12038 [Lentzea flaviverrucosa]
MPVDTSGFSQRVLDAEQFLAVAEHRLEQQERLGIVFISAVEGEVDASFNSVFMIGPRARALLATFASRSGIALSRSASLFVPAPGLLAVLCGGAYLVAAFLEPHGLAAADR